MTGRRLLGPAVAAAVISLIPGLALAGPHDGLPQPPDDLDRSTPRSALMLLLEATAREDWLRAAYALDLRSIAVRDQAEDGPERARMLREILDRATFVEPADLSDEEPGDLGDGRTDDDELTRLELGTRRVPIRLERVRLRDGTLVWVFSRRAVEAVPELHAAYGPSPLAQRLPPWMTRARYSGIALYHVVGLTVIALVAWLVGLLVGSVALSFAKRLATKTATHWDDLILKTARGPVRVYATVLGAWPLLAPLRLPATLEHVADRALGIGLIVGTGWLSVRVAQLVAELAERRAVLLAEDQGAIGRARGIRTQVTIVRRIVVIVLWVVTVSLVALQFDAVRNVGLSLLASAGVAGIILGLAAQRSLGGMLAGLQLSITQPVRIGDVVTIEGEWGTIEEMNLTYVVVRIWDKRRLVVPVSRLLEQPFQNWTRVSPDLLGTVFLHADYRVPVDKMREELDRLLADDPRWDRAAKSLLVTGATERAVELRAVVSAKNSSDLWDLRCHVREQLLAWLRDFEGGAYLPRARVETGREEDAADDARLSPLS